MTPDRQQARQTAEELAALVAMLDEVEGLEELLTTAQLDEDQRLELVRRVFQGRASEQTEHLLTVLARTGRLGLLRPVAASFRKLLEAGREQVEAVLTTAVALDDADRAAAAEALRRALGTEITLKTRVDERLLGGAVVRVGDRVYDASVAAELDRLGRRIAARRTDLFRDGAAGRAWA